VFWDWATAEALDMPTGTQIIRSIELITYFIQLCEIKFGIFIYLFLKQRASLFLKKRSALFLYLLIRVPIHYKDLQD
jgi:hypothetical protein